MSFHRTRIAISGLALALIVTACGGSENDASSASQLSESEPNTSTTTDAPETSTTENTLPEITLPPLPPADYAGFVAQPTACGGEAPTPVVPMTFDAPEDQGITSLVRATITTSCGDIVVELDAEVAPETVNSFVFLARAGYFDGSVSHRVVPGFVIQAGDQTATGREGPGYTIPDELPPDGFVYTTGSLAMANSGPNTTGSQFFITVADVPLPNDYTYFGMVVAGMDVIEAITQVPLGFNAFGEQSVPLETVYIEHVTIDE